MIARMVATVFGLGFLPGGPGTWASVAAIPLAWGLHVLGGFWLVAAVTVLLFGLGYWAATVYAPAGSDPAEVVIDEIVGMMVTLWPLSYGIGVVAARDPQVDPTIFPWPGWVVGFLLFRFFDILKPWPVSWADRKPGPTGVMLDDVVAGAISAVIVMIAAGVAHGRF